jgi:hypothetical protein
MVQIRSGITAPVAPSNATAVPGDRRAIVSWAAPANGGSPITGYTVTPYLGGVAQTPVTVTGTPPVTSVTVNGLTNGSVYTFVVSATNAIGSSPDSTASAAVVPSAAQALGFIQAGSIQGGGASTQSVTLPGALGSGRRLVVSVGVWSGGAAITTGVTDTAGDIFVELSRTKAADNTELTVWTAPITAGAGQKPQITARTSGTADIGVQALEYAGLQAGTDASVLDTKVAAVGRTSAAASVTSGTTAATAAAGELAIGFYADSGFGTALTGASDWAVRANLSPNGNMDLLAEDQTVAAAGARPGASVRTGPNTYWLMATLVFKRAAPQLSAPAAPIAVTATAGDGSASVAWFAPDDGGSVITSYAVTPYQNGVALPPVTVTGSPAPTVALVTGLTNGLAYTFTVTATNAVGASPPSVASAPVTPILTP